MAQKEKEFKTFRDFLNHAKKQKDTTGMKPDRYNRNHVEVAPDEHKYHGHVRGVYHSNHSPAPPMGSMNATLGNIKAFT